MRIAMLVPSWAVMAFLASGVMEANASDSDSGEAGKVQREFYTIDVQPMVAKFDTRHIVSSESRSQNTWYQMDTAPRVVVPPDAEAYLLVPEDRNEEMAGYKIVGRKLKGQSVSGSLFLLRRSTDDPKQSVLARFDFEVDAELKVPGKRRDFLTAKGRHFQHLWSEEMAGAAMFRHLATTSLNRIGETAESSGPNWPMRRRDSVDDSIQLMSGGRAVSENLQLDRDLGAGDDSGSMRSLADVRGITVREIDWTARLADGETELDPLAGSVPHDQHAVFLPSFASLAALVDQGNALARPAVQFLEPQSRKTDVMAFYQQQLGLPLNALTRQVGGALIDEVALTGSDPYFRTGTDVAVLMGSKQANSLKQAIATQVAALAAPRDGMSQKKHKVRGRDVTEWSTPDRHLCSFVGATDDAVIVTNSLQQMNKLMSCSAGKSRSLASLDEYRFFRQRYRRQATDESALLMISDATIRRWCSPEWRIAASRRTRARATIAEMTMRHADALVRGKVRADRQLEALVSMPRAGKLWIGPTGVRSDQFGTLQFQTPIAEMDMRLATDDEIKRYENWRRQYERMWRNAFDPIALKISLGPGSFSADLSVIPLMIRSDYRSWLQWIGSARLKASAGDHHPESLASYDMAIDLQAPMFGMARAFLSSQRGPGTPQIDLFGWIDGSVSVYLDRDKEWMKRVGEVAPMDAPDELIREMPIGIYVPSKDSFRLTACVVAVRGLLQQFAPNLLRWEQVEHEGITYVVGTVVENTPVGNAENLPQLYYVTTSDGLTMSLNRGVIVRSIDRHVARKKAASQAADAEPADRGEETNEDAVPGVADPHQHRPQIAAKIVGEGAMTMARADYRRGNRQMSRLAWSNLPILNYLHHRYPDRDPVEVYEQLLGERLAEPGEGNYVWVERFQTFESSHYGHHLAPRVGPAISPALKAGDSIKAALSFDDGGLRVKMTVDLED